MKKLLQITIVFQLLIIISGGVALAQDKVLLRGKVSDKSSGESLVGVSVLEVDRDNRVVGGTQTDLNGNYS